jgi:hypothetical protein
MERIKDFENSLKFYERHDLKMRESNCINPEMSLLSVTFFSR